MIKLITDVHRFHTCTLADPAPGFVPCIPTKTLPWTTGESIQFQDTHFYCATRPLLLKKNLDPSFTFALIHEKLLLRINILAFIDGEGSGIMALSLRDREVVSSSPVFNTCEY